MEDETTAPATENSSNFEPKKPEVVPAEHAELLPVLKPEALPAAPQENASVVLPEPVSQPTPAEVVPPVIEAPKPEADVVPAIIVPPKEILEQTVPQSAKDKLFGGNIFGGAGAVPQETSGIKPTERAEIRTLREVGIAERPESAKEAPERPDVADGLEDETRPSTRAVRTYAADMAEEIRKRGETLSSIVSAEQIKKAAEPEAPQKEAGERRGRIMLFLGAALFILAGIAIVAGVVLLMTAPKPQTYKETTLIPANATRVIAHDGGKTLTDELAGERANAQMNLGEIENIPVSANGEPVSAQDVLTDLGAPDLLARNALETMIGLHAFNKTQPFILIRVSAYDLAFQAMLAWEPTMAHDLGTFFAPSAPGSAAVPPAPFTFTDKVSLNVDTRVSDPSWPILYAFPQKDLLLITTNESTLKEIMARLASGHNAN